MARQLLRRWLGNHVLCHIVSSMGFWPQLFGRVPSLHGVCGEGWQITSGAWHRLDTNCFEPAVKREPFLVSSCLKALIAFWTLLPSWFAS